MQYFPPHRNAVTVGQFYDQWLKQTQRDQDLIPFNPGVILAYMYVGILFAKENWFDVLPDIDASVAGPQWGLEKLRVAAPKEPNPSLKYVLRRIRNALGHGNLEVKIPETGLTRDNLFDVVMVKFWDQDQRDRTDTFEAEMPLNGIFRLVKQLQSVIHKEVRQKY